VFLQLTVGLRFPAITLVLMRGEHARCNGPELSCVSDGGVPL
jgi:hypothetical protein